MLFPVVALLAVLVSATLSQGDSPGPGDRAPAFSGPLLDGAGALSLEDLKGKPVVLNFWASWCEPCEDEAPILKRAHEEYEGRIQFVGIDIRDARTDAVAFVKRTGLDYPHVRDEALEIYGDYDLTGQPETFFIDSDGVIVEHVNGPLFEDTLFELIRILETRDA